MSDSYVFVYSCSHLSLPGFCKPSYVFHDQNTNTPCQFCVHKTKWNAPYKRSSPRASLFEIKSMSLCSAPDPGTRERMWMCRAEGRGMLNKCCDFPSQGITENLLSISLHQETSSRKGRRIRLAGEKERVTFLILTGFSEMQPKHGECSGELGSGGEGAGWFASVNSSHLHERGSSKLTD